MGTWCFSSPIVRLVVKRPARVLMLYPTRRHA
jgi:hypothetical protein